MAICDLESDAVFYIEPASLLLHVDPHKNHLWYLHSREGRHAITRTSLLTPDNETKTKQFAIPDSTSDALESLLKQSRRLEGFVDGKRGKCAIISQNQLCCFTLKPLESTAELDLVDTWSKPQVCFVEGKELIQVRELELSD